jgi:hypothetical protein
VKALARLSNHESVKDAGGRLSPRHGVKCAFNYIFDRTWHDIAELLPSSIFVRATPVAVGHASVALGEVCELLEFDL